MPGSVLIARPNDFVVEDTAAGIVRVGFAPVRVRTPAELSAELTRPLCGVVMSTAISSVTGLSIGDTLRLVRKLNPAVPMVITSLSSVETARAALKAEWGALPEWPVLDAATSAADPRLGGPGVLLCVTRETLRNARGDAALSRHFAAPPAR